MTRKTANKFSIEVRPWGWRSTRRQFDIERVEHQRYAIEDGKLLITGHMESDHPSVVTKHKGSAITGIGILGTDNLLLEYDGLSL